MGVGQQSFVHIVRVGERYVLIGVSRGQVNTLAELDADQLEITERRDLPSFDSFFGRINALRRGERPTDDDSNNGSEQKP
jgi:flagellar biogenesis protein FliO